MEWYLNFFIVYEVSSVLMTVLQSFGSFIRRLFSSKKDFLQKRIHFALRISCLRTFDTESLSESLEKAVSL